jgi:hypothetical protein
LRKIERFWYITSIENLGSIFEYGILCHTFISLYLDVDKSTNSSDAESSRYKAAFHKLFKSNITSSSIRRFREHIEEISNSDDSSISEKSNYGKFKDIITTDISDSSVQNRRKEYHGYVPLFFADNTPMLYVKVQAESDSICLLEISNEVKDIAGVLFSNGNVASQETVVYGSLDGITNEEWKIIYSRQPTYWDRKRIRSAEVLVPFKVPVKYIKSISVTSIKSNLQALLSVMNAKLGIPVNMNLTPSGVRQ